MLRRCYKDNDAGPRLNLYLSCYWWPHCSTICGAHVNITAIYSSGFRWLHWYIFGGFFPIVANVLLRNTARPCFRLLIDCLICLCYTFISTSSRLDTASSLKYYDTFICWLGCWRPALRVDRIAHIVTIARVSEVLLFGGSFARLGTTSFFLWKSPATEVKRVVPFVGFSISFLCLSRSPSTL